MFEVPRIGQGTWQMEGDDRAACIEALRAGLDLGLTHVDTAELYGRGRVEELVGEAIAGRRDEVFLVSKVLPSNASRKGTLRACEASLKRLKTDRLDSYLLHWPGAVPLEDTLAAFEELQAAGKIRSYGVSNFDEELLAEAVRIAGRGRIACVQNLYNLDERHNEAVIIPYCQKNDIAFVGYSPLAGLQVKPELQAVAAELRATPQQVALAFLTRLQRTLAIPKAARAGHVRDNARLVTPSAPQLARLEQAYPLHVRPELPTA